MTKIGGANSCLGGHIRISTKYAYVKWNLYVMDIMGLIVCVLIFYFSLYCIVGFLRGKIFATFTNQFSFMKILPSKCLLKAFIIKFPDNLWRFRLGIGQFVKIFLLKNNLLYSIVSTIRVSVWIMQVSLRSSASVLINNFHCMYRTFLHRQTS